MCRNRKYSIITDPLCKSAVCLCFYNPILIFGNLILALISNIFLPSFLSFKVIFSVYLARKVKRCNHIRYINEENFNILTPSLINPCVLPTY